MYQETTDSRDAYLPNPVINPDDIEQFGKVETEPFEFRHQLHLRPEFTLDQLIELGRRLPDGPAFKGWQNGTIRVEDGWDARPVERLSFEKTIEGIAENNSLLVMKHVEQDPVFGPMLQDLLQEIFVYSPAKLRDEVTIGECLIFINSPKRKTPYHFDLESNFLLQIAGEKTVHAWANGDNSLVTIEELEDYCGVGNLSAAIYKPERQVDAFTTRLLPGDGTHFPSTGPHWVENGDEVSISINVNYDMRSLHHRMKYAFAINSRMRKLGLKPRDPGVSKFSDDLKSAAWVVARNAKLAARRTFGIRRDGEGYPVWRPVR